MSQTLLIAEGDPELCEVYKSFLAACGYEVETASNGLDCVEKLRRLTPAAIVLDRELSWGGGDGVLAWLRETNPEFGIPPVVLTATAGHTSDGAGDIEPPVVKLLLKPFALKALYESLQQAIAQYDMPVKVIDGPAGSELFLG
jgi:CheY-like chemotaxis protein